MRVNETKNTNFKGSFYDYSNGLEKNVLMSRALMVGINDIGWLAMANNNNERAEKARRMVVAFLIAFLAPVVTLPFSNRLAMKNFAKLTKSFWSDNHKAIHLSNKYLVSAEKTKEGLQKLSTNYTYSPFEKLYAKITGKKLDKNPLDFKPLIDKCGGDYEKLRQKLINNKIGVLASDFLYTPLLIGSINFVNNRITKKKTGQSGFSAEFNMADKELVEKRAEQYEKSWKKRYAIFATATITTGLSIPLILKKGLSANNVSKFSNFIKKHASNFDYTNGIYMSRLSMLLGCVLLGHTGTLLATRNDAELKDNVIRYAATDTLFFGGDLALMSILAGLSDRLFKTNLAKPANKKIEKIIPQFKSLEEVNEEVKAGKIAAKNKKFGAGIFWTAFALTTASIGFGVPKLVNALTQKDVQKDVKKQKEIE